MVERLFLAVPRGCLQFVIVVFPDHTHLLFLAKIWGKKSTVICCSTDCDTTNVPMCKYHGKVVPIKLIENPFITSSSIFYAG